MMRKIDDRDEDAIRNPVAIAYMRRGWKFYRDEWHNGHNGNLETDYQFQSPRMTSPATLYAFSRWSDQIPLSEDALLSAEASALAHNFIDSNEDAIKDGLCEVLEKQFRRREKVIADDLKIKFTVTNRTK